MSISTPRKIPHNWYKYDIKFSVEILREYIRGIENQIDASIFDFQNSSQIQTLESSIEEEPIRAIKWHRGLDEETWDLENIFESTFPNLQRGSALITLYSYFEHELDRLCQLFIDQLSMTVAQSDMSGKGIERAVLFLTKIINLPIDKNSSNWKEIANIKKIRNQITYENYSLIDKSGQKKGDLIKYVEDSVFLIRKGNDILIGKGYLEHTLSIFDNLFEEVDTLIQKQINIF